jgi:hypothetical protein
MQPKAKAWGQQEKDLWFTEGTGLHHNSMKVKRLISGVTKWFLNINAMCLG